MPTGEGFLPVNLVGKGDEISILVYSSLIRKRVEPPPFSRGNAESSFNRDLGVSVLAFPHVRPTATAWPGSEGGDALAETNEATARHSWCFAVRSSGERRLSRLLSCPT